jgi:hypothetical protein
MGGNAAELVTYSLAGGEGAASLLALACGGDCLAPQTALDRTWFKGCDAETAASTLTTNTGIRLARKPTESATPLPSDDAPRQLKAPSFAVVKGLQALFPSNAKRGISLNDCFPADLQQLKARLQPLQRLDTGTLDEEVSELLRRVTARTDNALEILQARQVRLNQLLPAGGPKQPPQDLIQLLARVADDLQKRLDYDTIIADSREKLADLQDQFNEFPPEVAKLRRTLEMRFGRP